MGSFCRHCAVRSRATSLLPRRCASRARQTSGPPSSPAMCRAGRHRCPQGFPAGGRAIALAPATVPARPGGGTVVFGASMRRRRTAHQAPARTARRSLPTCPQRAACASATASDVSFAGPAVTSPAVTDSPNQLRRSEFSERPNPWRSHVHAPIRPPHRTQRNPLLPPDRPSGSSRNRGLRTRVDQSLQRGRCGPGILGTRRRFVSKPLEGETPARPLARRHLPVPAQVRGSRQGHELVDLVPHHIRIGGAFADAASDRACRLRARPRYARARPPCRASRGSTVPSADDPRRAPIPPGRTARGSFASPTQGDYLTRTSGGTQEGETMPDLKAATCMAKISTSPSMDASACTFQERWSARSPAAAQFGVG